MSKDLETIEQLIQFMEKHGLTELQVRQGELEFKASRGTRRDVPMMVQPAHGIVHAVQEAAPKAQGAAAPAAAEKPAAAKGQEICSPIVGTFYRSPSPGAPPFKDAGDRVEKDDVVCIVEAMKVMNEIRAEVSGVIKKVLVEDANPVEFGQPLFLVEKAG